MAWLPRYACYLQGALAPVAASVALFGGYLLVKYLPDISLQTVFDAYFWLLGTVAIAGALAPPLRTLVGAADWVWEGQDTRVEPVPESCAWGMCALALISRVVVQSKDLPHPKSPGV